MSMTHLEIREANDASPVSALLQQRAQLQQWLEKLEQHGGDASPAVVQRVRADYQERMLAVLDELGRHLDALRAERDARADAAQGAGTRHREAEERLEEARLRHLIGELAESEWLERRAPLEEAVDEARSERAEAEADAERLGELVAQVEAGLHPAGAVAAEPEDEEEAPPVVADLTPEGEPDASGAGEQDLAFLEELDRAIGGEAEGAGAIRPKQGAKCPECGYTNDADAWYCGVCGIDLA
jgi:hypothetical protein